MNRSLRTPATRFMTFVLLPILLFITLLQLYSIYLHTDVFRTHVPPRFAIDVAAFTTRSPLLLPKSAASQCSTLGTGCATVMTRVINQDRALHGAGPLTLDWPETHGTATCPGSSGHAHHLAQVVTSTANFGQFSHDQFPADICVGYRTAGENVGMAMGSKYNAMMLSLDEMLQEGWVKDCTGNHACNLRNPLFTHVGIGFAFNGTYWFTVQDFTG